MAVARVGAERSGQQCACMWFTQQSASALQFTDTARPTLRYTPVKHALPHQVAERSAADRSLVLCCGCFADPCRVLL